MTMLQCDTSLVTLFLLLIDPCTQEGPALLYTMWDHELLNSAAEAVRINVGSKIYMILLEHRTRPGGVTNKDKLPIAHILPTICNQFKSKVTL